MSNKNFLNELKSSLEKGEFNSEIAKKINKIEEKSKTITPKEAEEKLKERVDSVGNKKYEKDELDRIKKDYEKYLTATATETEVFHKLRKVFELHDSITLKLLELDDLINEIDRNNELEILKKSDDDHILKIIKKYEDLKKEL